MVHYRHREQRYCGVSHFRGMKHLFPLMLAVVALNTVAQNSGTLRLLVEPGHDFQFVVDYKHKLQKREVDLSEGLHHLSVWAPTRMIVDTSVFVVANRTSDLVMKLPLSPEFIAYKGELARYQVRKRWTLTAPILALAGGLTWTGIAYGKYSKARDRLASDRGNYAINVDPASIATLKNVTIPDHNKELRQARTGLFAATGVSVLSAAATWWLMRRTARWEEPRFHDLQKVKFDGLAWSPDQDGGLFMAGLTIHLAR